MKLLLGYRRNILLLGCLHAKIWRIVKKAFSFQVFFWTGTARVWLLKLEDIRESLCLWAETAFPGRQKKSSGAGHPFKLSLTDRLLMLLVYYHLYVSSTLAAYLFDLSQTNVLKNIRKLEPLVSDVLPLPKKMHQKVRRLQTLDEVEAMFPGFKAFLDATEQEIPRPKNKRKRRTHYSGKKKSAV